MIQFVEKEVEITEDMIKRSLRVCRADNGNLNTCCPVAMAIKDAGAANGVLVSARAIECGSPGRPLNRAAREFVHEFDVAAICYWLPPKPCKLKVPVPIEVPDE